MCHILHAFLTLPGPLLRTLRQDFLVAFPADVSDLVMCLLINRSLCVCVCLSLYIVCVCGQNRLVDVCEKMQLQALRIEKFIDQTLSVKEQKLQVRRDTHFATP